MSEVHLKKAMGELNYLKLSQTRPGPSGDTSAAQEAELTSRRLQLTERSKYSFPPFSPGQSITQIRWTESASGYNRQLECSTSR